MKYFIDVLTGGLIIDWRGSVPAEHVIHGTSHAGHLRLTDITVTVEVVKTEDPTQLLLHSPP